MKIRARAVGTGLIMAAAIGATLFSGTAQAMPAQDLTAPAAVCADPDTPVHTFDWFQKKYPNNGLGAMFALNESQEKAARAVHCLVNAERTAHGLVPLLWSDKLRDSAHDHAHAADAQKWWRDSANFHINPRTPRTYSDDNREQNTQIDKRIREQSPCTFYVGDGHQLVKDAENTYQGWGGDTAGPSTPRAAVAWWMQSPSHRAAILDPDFNRLGVGVIGGSANPSHANRDPAGIFVQHFGTCR